MRLEFIKHDGGRSNYFKASNVGDCVTRAIAIVTERDYKEVYKIVKRLSGESPRNGIKSSKVKKIMQYFGGTWVPLSGIGTGCTTHLTANEIPMQGKMICKLSHHVTAIIDGVNYDTYDSSRNGSRCVYGYWKF